jgi:SAM-dependent methyltransferase
VGAGSGTITTWLANRVSNAGNVVAADIDPRFLAWIDNPIVDVRKFDLTADALEENTYDLVYERMVLMHIRDPDTHLTKLVRAVRPGGWILLQDVDLAWNETQAARSLMWPPRNHRFNLKVVRALNTLLSMGGARPDYALGTPHRLMGLGLEDVGVEVVIKIAWGEPGGPYAAAFDRVRPYLVQFTELTERDVERQAKQLEDPTCGISTAPMVSVWGRRPR